ncbi:nicotinate-nucleotide--dimethylbenzimidazole phosphoribosyltransferase [Streptomyces sp. NPDC001617]
MTDTGQVPGEGLPENSGMVEQPGVAAHGAYTYLSETTAEDEDLLLLPGAQSPWGNEVAPPAPEPVVETVHEPGPHEMAGRDSGSVDLSGVRLPNQAPIPPITPRRPLHLGPPLPDTSASPVRSLADRGPAGAPVRHPGPPTVGPEYLDATQVREMPPQGAIPWSAQAPGAVQAPVSAEAPAAETVVPPQQHAEPAGVAQAVMARVATEAGAAAQEPDGGYGGHAAQSTALSHDAQTGQNTGTTYDPQAAGTADAAGAAYGPEGTEVPVGAPAGEGGYVPVGVSAAEGGYAVGTGAAAGGFPADPGHLSGGFAAENAPVAPGGLPAEGGPAFEAGPATQGGHDAASGLPADNGHVAAAGRAAENAHAARSGPADGSGLMGAEGAHAAPIGPAADGEQAAAGAFAVEGEQAAVTGPAVPVGPIEQVPQTAVAAPSTSDAAQAGPTGIGPEAEPTPEAGLAPEAGQTGAAPAADTAAAAVMEVEVEATQRPDAGSLPGAAHAAEGASTPESAQFAEAVAPADGLVPGGVQVAEGVVSGGAQFVEGVAPGSAESSATAAPEPAELSDAGTPEPGRRPDAVAPEAMRLPEAVVPQAPQTPEAVASEAVRLPEAAVPEAPRTPEPAAPDATPAVHPALVDHFDPAHASGPEPAEVIDPAVPAHAPGTVVTPESPEAVLPSAPDATHPPQPTDASAAPTGDATITTDPSAAQVQSPHAVPGAQPGPDAAPHGGPSADAPVEAVQSLAAANAPAPIPEDQPGTQVDSAFAPQPLAVNSAGPAPGDTTGANPPVIPLEPRPDQSLGQFVPVEGSIPTTPHLAPTPPHALVLPTEEAQASGATVPAPREADPELVQHADDLDTRAADQEEESTAAVEDVRQSTGPAAPAYDEAEREAVMKVMRERRDIRNGFRSDPIPHEVLLRVLEAAHTAPSVGHSQPWDFVVIRSADTRRTMHELAMRQRDAYAKSLPKGRAKQFKELKIEAILDTPVNIVVTADPTRGGRHTLGRHTQPQMAPYSAALAVENLWLAARAEGLGVGWVSFFDEREMVRALGLPEHLEVIAYLCVGYVDEFPDEPELMQAGWSKRRPLSWVVHEETYGRRALPGEEPHDLLAETVAQIRPLDAKALGEAWERQKRMTKPAGALGMLEIISAQLSGLSRQCPPPIPEPAAVAIFAGDHGVHAQGVTPWPQEVTAQMVANFLGGGAVCNAFAGQVGAEVCVVDVGVATELPATPGLLPRKIRAGTSDMTAGPAMTREEAKLAIEVGIETARDLVAAGNKALLTGEMGIANTTASAALISVFTDTDPAEVTGRGTGINDETLARKTEVVRRAIELHHPDPADPVGVLAAIGGFEHAAMVGLLLGGASLRTPVILDGVSAGAAALVARAIAPEVLAACIAGHRSAEPGHVAALNKLGLRPLVDLDLRLGEGTGALLALPLVQSTARAMHEVATFDSAGVTEK